MKTTLKIFSLIFIIFSLFTLATCNSDGAFSTITINLGVDNSKATVGIEQLRHEITFTGPTGTQRQTVTGRGTARATVVAGLWTIEVAAYYGQDLYAVGGSSAEVIAGRNTNVSIQMTVVWADGAGVINPAISYDKIVGSWAELREYIENGMSLLQSPIATIQVAKNLAANDLIIIPINHTVTLVAPIYTTVIISHGSSSFRDIFRVEGTLNLGHGSYPDNSRVILDGASTNPISAPLIQIDGGTLNMNNSVILQNNNNINTSPPLGGAVGTISGGGTFNMRGGIIRNNKASSGGGVYVSGTSLGQGFFMSGGTISGNVASNGGGVYADGTFEMSGGAISGNSAFFGGGVRITNTGSFEMSDGAISGNKADQLGGGVFNDSSPLYINGDAKIFNNRVEYTGGTQGNGGGVNSEGDLYISGDAKIFNNTVESANDAHGGGVYVWSAFGANLSISGNAEITNNTVFTSGGGGSAYGGGVYFSDSTSTYTFELSENAKINNNIAIGSMSDAALGGGVCVDYGTFDMTGGEIKGNTAQTATSSAQGGGVYVNVNSGAAFLKTSGLIDGYGSGDDPDKNKVIEGGVIVASASDPGHAVFCDESMPFGKNKDSLDGNVLDTNYAYPNSLGGWDF